MIERIGLFGVATREHGWPELRQLGRKVYARLYGDPAAYERAKQEARDRIGAIARERGLNRGKAGLLLLRESRAALFDAMGPESRLQVEAALADYRRQLRVERRLAEIRDELRRLGQG
jgi:hypothetical protein